MLAIGALGAMTITAHAQAVTSRPTPTPTPTPTVLVCPPNEPRTPGVADTRIDTYCKRQLIRDRYKGKIDERVFNFDLSIGMTLEAALEDAQEEQFG